MINGDASFDDIYVVEVVVLSFGFDTFHIIKNSLAFIWFYGYVSEYEF